jgi:hypothetical protein
VSEIERLVEMEREVGGGGERSYTRLGEVGGTSERG